MRSQRARVTGLLALLCTFGCGGDEDAMLDGEDGSSGKVDAGPSDAASVAPPDASVTQCVPDESRPVPPDRCTTDPANTTLPACDRWQLVAPAGATCGDGSPYKFFVNYTAASNNLVIMFEPGGACWDYASCTGSARGAANARGIPDHHMDRFQYLNLLRRDATNPVRDWNMVFVSYCTGDVHVGRRVASYENPQGGPPRTFRHVGLDNTLKVLDWLAPRFPHVPRLLVTGCSAGGVGALQNYAFVRQRLAGAQCGYLLDDSGPAFHSDGPSGQQHEAVRAAWGTDAVFDELAGLLNVPATELHGDFARINTALADRYPHDRLSLTAYELDLNYSLYAYERFYPGASESDIHALWSSELTKLLATYDTRANLAYYVPYFRSDNCSHCVSLPPLSRDVPTILSSPWLGSEIEADGVSLRSFTELLLDDAQPLRRYRERPQPNEGFSMQEASACMAAK